MRKLFNKIVPDEQLAKAIWMRGLEGDATCLRMCADFKWGKVRPTPEAPQKDRIGIAVLVDGEPLPDTHTP